MNASSLRIVKLVARKLAQLAVVLLCVTLFTFLLVRLLPGDPEDLLVPAADNTTNAEDNATVRAQKERVRADMGLDDPLPVQYLSWLGDFVQGDMGYIYGKQTRTPVSDRIGPALPPTLQLILYSQVIALGVAIPVAVAAAYRQGGLLDRFVNAVGFGMLSFPNFAVALVLAYVVGVRLNPYLPEAIDIPPLGYERFSWEPQAFLDHFFSMLLPSISLALAQIAVYMRVLRSDMIQTLQEDFILMAKSKGVSNRRVLLRHALRPSSLTLVTIAGLQVGTLIGGTVVIEVLFEINGMGKFIYEAILRHQYVALQSSVAIVAIGFVLINAFLDVLYTVLDPRIRHAG